MTIPTEAYRHVVASWSGGIDSTGVVANLLKNGYFVKAVSLNIYGGEFGQREREAREALVPELERVAADNNGTLISHGEVDASWIWAFSPDGKEIPRRNKHIIDHLITNYCMPHGIKNIGMGEYIGADSWLVQDHVSAADADHRSLSAYIFNEYGLEYRMLSLADFGESRYKIDRARLLVDAVGMAAAFKTSNCLYDYSEHCGECYKCIERAVAFDHLLGRDDTVYRVEPRENETYVAYAEQMQGEKVTRPMSAVSSGRPVKMPRGATT